MARIVLNTFGSFGDVHPYLAIAIELQRRGHECVVATAEIYRQKIVAEGVGFAQVRPDVGELLTQPEMIRKLWHPTRGSKYLLRDYLLPQVEQSFHDLDRASHGAELIITHVAAYAGPVVAAVRKIPWLSVALQPAIFFSKHDPPVIAALAWARHLYSLGEWVFAAMLTAVQQGTRHWAKPVFELRKRLQIEDNSNPVMEGAFSPLGTMTLFSEAFAKQQPDWPSHSKPTGFVFYDKRGEMAGLPAEPLGGLSDSLRAFLAAGPPPILFTLGSSAITDPGAFYQESAKAAQMLNARAVLLVGNQQVPNNELIHVERYAPYSMLMPQVAAVVHQGGIGTVAQSLRAGKPMLVVPWSHDQPDNAYRLEKLGVARSLPRHHYVAHRAARELASLQTAGYFERAKKLAAVIEQEDGLTAACDRVEEILRASLPD